MGYLSRICTTIFILARKAERNFLADDMIPEIDKIEKDVVKYEERMDSVMQTSRSLIRLCGKSITAMHSRDMKEAEEMLAQVTEMGAKLSKLDTGLEQYSLQAYQEYAEAKVLYYIIKNGSIPSMKEVGVNERAYLLGLMDVVGELKREAFESLRKNDIGKAEKYYQLMVDIYDSTLHMRFAGMVLPDFRRKQDVARIQIESTVGELVRRGTK